VEERWRDWTGHVIVAGLHDVGLSVVEQLHAAGERVIVVDDAPDLRLLPLIDQWGVPHLIGSARRESTLITAGVKDAAALLCLSPHDLDNLEAALLARRLRNDLRVVVQLDNPAVGRAVGRVTGPGTVLDVASLAAPTFAESCLELTERNLDIDGEAFLVQELNADRGGSLRTLFGDLAPIAVIPADGTEMHICPGRDTTVVPGDRVVVVAAASDLHERRLPATPTVKPRRRTGPLAAIRRYIAGFVAETDHALRLTLGALVAVALISMIILRFGYGPSHGRSMSVLDALYFTTETLTTVGFGDFYFADQPTWLRVWAIVLMVVGAAIVTVVYALLTNVLVSRRMAQSLGRQMATQMRGHIIVVGLGSVGVRVLEGLLAAGQHVVVLERDENNRYLANARAMGVPVVIGDSTIPASLDAANLDEARAVAVLTSSDLANIETGLAVDELLGSRRTEVPVVLRVFDRDLARSIEASFGFRYVRSTAALAAPWFVGAALGLDILSTFYVDRQPMLIGRLVVAESGGLRGRTMQELSARIRVIAIKRRASGDVLEYPPRRDTRFEGGDHAYLVGPYEELLTVLRHDRP
jgi:Trk K+ transport system NAD-binding subunit